MGAGHQLLPAEEQLLVQRWAVSWLASPWGPAWVPGPTGHQSLPPEGWLWVQEVTG